MSEDAMPGRVARLENSVARVEVQINSLDGGQKTIMTELGKLGDQLDKSRPSIGAIWTPLAALTAVLTLIGSAVAVPQLARISNIEAINHDRTEPDIQQRIAVAILKHDAERAK